MGEERFATRNAARQVLGIRASVKLKAALQDLLQNEVQAAL